MQRIAILGRSGSGKSTLANKIGKILHRPVIHLDKLFWNPDWTPAFSVKQDWIDFVSKMTEGSEWIIDGNYHRSVLKPRLENANMLVFLDYSLAVCLWRVLKRRFFGSKISDRHSDMKEKLRFDFIKYMFTYPSKEILNKVLQYKNIKKVYFIRNDKDIVSLIKDLS